MSEWKWCGNCDHNYDQHGKEGARLSGPCSVVDCDCPRFYMVDTP